MHAGTPAWGTPIYRISIEDSCMGDPYRETSGKAPGGFDRELLQGGLTGGPLHGSSLAPIQELLLGSWHGGHWESRPYIGASPGILGAPAWEPRPYIGPPPGLLHGGPLHGASPL